jgi:hypothetical protein
MCRRIVTQLAMALKHEQERCQYLHTEVFKVLQLRYGLFDILCYYYVNAIVTVPKLQ